MPKSRPWRSAISIPPAPLSVTACTASRGSATPAASTSRSSLDPRQIGRQILGDPVGEILLLAVVAQGCKRQHDDRQAWPRPRGPFGDCKDFAVWIGFGLLHRSDKAVAASRLPSPTTNPGQTAFMIASFATSSPCAGSGTRADRARAG